MLQQTRRRRGWLDQSPAGREVATQYGNSRPFADRLLPATNHFCIPARRVGGIVAHGLAVHGESVFVDQVAEARTTAGTPPA